MTKGVLADEVLARLLMIRRFEETTSRTVRILRAERDHRGTGGFA
jgi:hypothetical protein